MEKNNTVAYQARTEVPESQLLDHMRGPSPGLVGELGPRRWYRGDRPFAAGAADACRVSRWPDHPRVRADLMGLGRVTITRPGQDRADLVAPAMSPVTRLGVHRDQADLVAVHDVRAHRGLHLSEMEVVGHAETSTRRGRHQDRADLTG